MRIVIDGRMLSWTGIGRYTLALLESLEANDQTNDFLVLMRRADWSKWTPSADNFKRIECNIAPYTLAEQARLPLLLRHLAPDVVHFVTPNAAALYGGRKVVTVHDLTLLDFDTSRGSFTRLLSTKIKRYPYRLIFRRQVTTATRILTVSEYVQKQLAERFGIDRLKVVTAWNAADSIHLSETTEERVADLDERDLSLLYIGNFYLYKNVRILIEALALIATAWPNLKLVLAGNTGEFKDELLSLAQTLKVSDRVVMPGFVTDGQLKWLYRNSTLYVNPSFSEGFGLQGLEAMTHGLPVLSSTASCLPEVYGDAAVYFDPHNASELAQKITDLLEKPGWSLELSAKGYERVSMFSWQKTARITHQVYMDAGHEASHTKGNGAHESLR